MQNLKPECNKVRANAWQSGNRNIAKLGDRLGTNTRVKKLEMKMSVGALKAVPRYLEEISTIGGLKGTDIANITDVSKATVSRWKAGDIRPQPSNELILSDLHYVVGRLQEFYTAQDIRTWLYALHPQLNGERAMDLIHEARTVEVLKVIDRLENEVYV